MRFTEVTITMVRLHCKKCNNVCETEFFNIMSVHVGPYHILKCPACNKGGWFNFYSSVKDPVTWPVPEKTVTNERTFTEEELEKKRIEDSKYERT